MLNMSKEETSKLSFNSAGKSLPADWVKASNSNESSATDDLSNPINYPPKSSSKSAIDDTDIESTFSSEILTTSPTSSVAAFSMPPRGDAAAAAPISDVNSPLKEPSSIICCPIVRHKMDIKNHDLSKSRMKMNEEELAEFDNLSPFKTWNFTNFLLPSPSEKTTLRPPSPLDPISSSSNNNNNNNTNASDTVRNTLALDLDETLIYASTSSMPNADAVVTVHVPSGARNEPSGPSEPYSATAALPSSSGSYLLYLKYRPYLDVFLRYVIQRFEVIVFTASRYYYCGAILRQMEKDFPYLRFMKPDADAAKLNHSTTSPDGILRPSDKHHITVLHRDHCTPTNAGYIKDLHLLGRSLKRCILIDNNVVCGAFQPYNFVLIKDFNGTSSTAEPLSPEDKNAALRRLREEKGYVGDTPTVSEFQNGGDMDGEKDTVLLELIQDKGLLEALSTCTDVPLLLTQSMEYNVLSGKH